MTRAQVKEEIRNLAFQDRVELLEELWREAENEHPDLLDWQREILDRRLDEAKRDPDGWVSWEEARQRLEHLAKSTG